MAKRSPDPVADRPHEPGVDPPTTPEQEQKWMGWARTLTDIELRRQYRRYYEIGERAGIVCSILNYVAIERAATNDDLQKYLHDTQGGRNAPDPPVRRPVSRRH